MKAFLGWLANRALLYALLVAAIGFALIAWPSLSDVARGFGDETLSRGALIEQVEALRDEGQGRLESTARQARNLSAAELRQRIETRLSQREVVEKRLEEAGEEWLSGFLPSRIIDRKRAQIELAVIDREIAVLEAAIEPREAAARAGAFIADNPTVPTTQSIAASRRACIEAGEAVDDFDELSGIERAIRNLLRDESDTLESAQQANCADLARLTERRKAGIEAARALVAANEQLAALTAAPLASSYARDITGVTLRDVLVQALIALLLITCLPYLYRVIAYHALAPIAERRAAIRFAAGGDTVTFEHEEKSAVSVAVTLQEGEAALVRQGFLQSSTLAGEKRTQWLLDARYPITSFVSGMRFLTRISGTGGPVTVSAVNDPFAELCELAIPIDSAAIVRPAALAALAFENGRPPHVTSHWRLFSLPAWLTGQLRYFMFHGPVRLVLKGGRGVRVERAHSGRILGQSQVIGFSSDLAYSVVRTETFWPYFFGRQPLLKDRVEDGAGVVFIEESPLAGRSGMRRGIEGAFDAMLKAFGV